MASYFCLLTAPGTAAIASFALWGPLAWETIRKHFQLANQKKELPTEPSTGQSWFGSFGDEIRDEVILVCSQVQPVNAFEIHCHGGREIQRIIEELLIEAGLTEVGSDIWLERVGYPSEVRSDQALKAWRLLPQALTVKTAGILLDQIFINALEPGAAAFEEIGKHLTRAWKVAIVGPPNVGKSSLVNALAGYRRSIVAPVPGTTRDTVTVQIAIEGWPIELTDTAGLRETSNEIEGEGIQRTQQQMQSCDLLLWMIDASFWDSIQNQPLPKTSAPILKVVNKIDLLAGQPDWGDWLPISVQDGRGLNELMSRIIQLLVPIAPKPGQGVALP